jgi:hypothetical protein
MLDKSGEQNLIEMHGVCRSFPKGRGEDLLVLDKVDPLRRDRQPARTIRLGKVDLAAHHRRPRYADLG